MDAVGLERIRQTHAGWRLLASPHSPLVVSVLHAAFVETNTRAMSQSDLAARLDDHLFQLRDRKGEHKYPLSAIEYLDEWASDAHSWLRKYYPAQGDEPHFDLTPGAERAIEWLSNLRAKPFVGTESRLMTVFRLLQEIVEGTELDVEKRLAELHRRRELIDREIARVEAGYLDVLDPTQVRGEPSATPG